jgi:peptidoglycan/xylan/chitin deacetylase (PgdA/CDA1 family)
MRRPDLFSALKSHALGLLDRSGVGEQVGLSPWRRQRLLVLCYHGVARGDEHEWLPSLYISREAFEGRLALLRDSGCTVLPLVEGLQRLYARELPERAVVLTFDDGYYDFLTSAWPALNRFGFPATVYLTTGRVEPNLPNVNLFISYALWSSADRTLDGRGLPGLSGHYALRTADERDAVFDRVVTAFRAARLPDRLRDEVARTIAARLGIDYDGLAAQRLLTLLRPDEISQLAAEGVDFQLHSHEHRSPVDAAAFVRDVLVNQQRIEALTGHHAVHFCYPSGNYRPTYPEALARAGIASATTCDPALATPLCDPMILPRFVDSGSVTPLIFRSWLTGLADRLPRRSRRGGDAEIPDDQALPDVAGQEGGGP